MTVSRLIYVISDGTAAEERRSIAVRRLLDHARAAAEAGATHYQIREKGLPARTLFKLASELAEAVKETGLRVLVNDRADIAAAAGADGVHLTSRSFTAAAVRRAFGAEMLIAVSAHRVEEVIKAKEQGADMAVFGPVFETPGKKAAGPDRLREACSKAPGFPVLALGGIDASNAAEAIAAGASGIAAIRSLSNPEDIARMAAVLNHG